MGKTKQIVRTLAAERGYTLEDLADELEDRGWDVAVEGQETQAAVHNPVYYSNLMFTPALEVVFDLTREQTDTLFWTLLEDAKEEVRRWRTRT